MDVGQAEVAALETVGRLRELDPKQVEDHRVQVAWRPTL
jgi:hypothetical protein